MQRGGANMSYYRVYLLNADDHIVAWHAVIGDSDNAAVVAAAGIVRDCAVEIWTGTRRVAGLSVAELERCRALAAG
jgi:hypothetical protein